MKTKVYEALAFNIIPGVLVAGVIALAVASIVTPEAETATDCTKTASGLRPVTTIGPNGALQVQHVPYQGCVESAE